MSNGEVCNKEVEDKKGGAYLSDMKSKNQLFGLWEGKRTKVTQSCLEWAWQLQFSNLIP